MVKLFISALVAFVVFSVVLSSNVKVLTDENFLEVTSTGKWLVDFYAPWCPHCKKLEPVYNQAAFELHKGGIPLQLAKMDCTQHSGVAGKLGIQGYPTLKYVRGGLVTDYVGGRSKGDFINFGKKVTAKAVQSVTEKNLKKFKTKDDVTFLLVSKSNAEAKSVFDEVASMYQDIASFGHSTDTSILEKEGVEQDKELDFTIVCFNDVQPTTFPDALTKANLKQWVNDHKLPVVANLSPSNYDLLVNNPPKKPVVFAGIVPGDHEEYASALRSIASDYTASFKFSLVDCNRFKKFMAQFGVYKAELPQLTVFDPVKDVYFTNVTIGKTAEDIKSFLDAVIAGEVQAQGAGSGFVGQAKHLALTAINNLQDNPVLLAVLVGAILVLVGLCLCVCCLEDSDEVDEDHPAGARRPAAKGDKND